MSSYSILPDNVTALPQNFDMTLRWAEQLPMGGASAVIGMRRAIRAVQSGDAEIVACIGGDTNRKGAFADLVGNFSSFSREAVNPYGAGGPTRACK